MLDRHSLNNLLKRYPVLHQVPAHLQHKTREDGSSFEIPDDNVLFHLDSPCSNFVMPVAGAIRVVRPSESGREILLYRLEPGDVCIITAGCLLGDTAYMACAYAEGDLAAVSLPKQLFLQLVEGSAPFRAFVFRYFGERLSELTELIEAVAFQKLDQRLAALLLVQGPRLEVTHQMLAIELGSVREVVSRILQDFKHQGAVVLDRGRIHIVDESILREIAHPSV